MCQCQQDHESPQHDRPVHSDPFPWHLGAFDAHCHPTDTMASIAAIKNMHTRALTIMATRSQDQDLVSQVSSELGITDSSSLLSDTNTSVIPAFGWHPWFSYQLCDDTSSKIDSSSSPSDTMTPEQKLEHYSAVLAPSTLDPDFLASLPNPTPLSELLASTRRFLQSNPHALVGEVGLDKAFRIPRQWDTSDAASRDGALTPGGREGRLLSPHRVRVEHQQAILTAQLRLAGEMGRAVSVHGVQAHGVLLTTISSCWKGYEREVISRREKKMVAPGAEDDDDDNEDARTKEPWNKPFPPRICLHSFSGSSEVLKQWLHPSIPADIYFSFSEAVNLGTEATRAKVVDVIRLVPEERILVETDLHTAGSQMDDALEAIYRAVCDIKGWGLDEGVIKIGENFQKFIFG